MYKILTTLLSVLGIIMILACEESEEKIIEPDPIPTPIPPIEEDKPILSEIELKATGSSNTYDLINSVLAPGYNVVEAPDCSHTSFGEHIDEIFDADLDSYVFRFFIHTTPDNDRCKKFDRQRNEIKSYDKSPSELKGIVNEKVVYSWKFKLSENFKSSSSFTHIHQIKAVGGDEESMPLITLTTRKGSPDRLQLRYSEHLTQVTLTEIDLAPFKGNWVEVEETVVYGEQEVGTYEVVISDVKSKKELFNYKNESIRMWKNNASFMRPKWGIYRSLNDAESLKDEEVLFADFNIKEMRN